MINYKNLRERALKSLIHLLATPGRVETKKLVHHVYIPFPGQLKKSERRDWGVLQTKIAVSFEKSYTYCYESNTGIHIWYSKEEFEGLPETAAQQPLEDGRHLVLGKKHRYVQTWQGGQMIYCCPVGKETEPSGLLESTVEIQIEQPWAKIPEIVVKLSSPSIIAKTISSVFSLVIIWYIGAATAFTIQLKAVELETTAFEESMDKLISKATEVRRVENALGILTNWKLEHGFLPSGLSLIITHLDKTIEWEVNSIKFQNKKIEVAFKSSTADIAGLISTLENTKYFFSVNIRPENTKDSWVIEAILK